MVDDEGMPGERGAALGLRAAWLRPAVAASGGEATLLLRVTAAARPGARTPVDLAMVLDRSGSMAGGKLDLAKAAVRLVMSRLQPEDRAAVVVFDDEADVVASLAPVTPRLGALTALGLREVEPRGSTALADGWALGCDELASDARAGRAGGRRRLRRALLLTDGQANVGEQRPEQLAARAMTLRRHGIGTTALGLGLGFNEELLATLAEAGGGNFEFVADPATLATFFARELGDLLATSALGATVQIDLPKRVEADLLNHLPCERRDDRLTIQLGDLPAGADLDLVLRLRHARSAVGSVRRATAILRWEDAATGQSGRDGVATPPLATVADAEVAGVAVDPVVAEAEALLVAAAEQREAARLDRAGRYAESRACVQVARLALAAAPQTARTVAVDRALLPMESAAPYGEQLRKEAYWDSSRRARGRDREAGPNAA